MKKLNQWGLNLGSRAYSNTLLLEWIDSRVPETERGGGTHSVSAYIITPYPYMTKKRHLHYYPPQGEKQTMTI